MLIRMSFENNGESMVMIGNLYISRLTDSFDKIQISYQIGELVFNL